MDIALFGGASTVDKLQADVAVAAGLGFSSFWTPQVFDLDALTAIAAIASSTPEMRFGTGVIPTYPRHPMMLAQQALTVSQVTGGRLDLGIGLSHKPVVEGMWGVSFDKPVRHMSDYLTILTALLRGERVSHSGESVIGRGEITISADPPPVIVAALGPQMLRVAGHLADGTLTWMTGPRTVAELTAPTINAAAAEAGRPAPRVCCAVPTCVTSDIDARRARAAKDYVIYGELPSYKAMLDREGYGGPEEIALIGDIATVKAGLQRYIDGGATTIVASVFGTTEEQDATRHELASLL